MGHRPPDQSVLEEIRALAARLEITQFESLSTGIGIGDLRPVQRTEPTRAPLTPPPGRPAPQLPPLAPHQAPAPTPHQPTVVRTPEPRPALAQWAAIQQQHASMQASRGPERPRRPRGGVTLWLFSHLTDLCVVLMTLVACLAVVSYFMGQGGADSLLRSMPMRVLRDLGPIKSIIGLYVLFAFYWLFFRLMAGMTLGEIFFRQKAPVSR